MTLKRVIEGLKQHLGLYGNKGWNINSDFSLSTSDQKRLGNVLI